MPPNDLERCTVRPYSYASAALSMRQFYFAKTTTDKFGDNKIECCIMELLARLFCPLIESRDAAD